MVFEFFVTMLPFLCFVKHFDIKLSTDFIMLKYVIILTIIIVVTLYCVFINCQTNRAQ